MSLDFNLKDFVFERVLNDDPQARMVTLLGTYKTTSSELEKSLKPAIVRIEKTALPAFSDGLVARTEVIDSNDIYTWLFGWLHPSDANPDLKVNIICPATETHIRKYSRQQVHIVRETPDLYATIVKPYIDAFPVSRTQWVSDIISGTAEASKVLFRSPSDDPHGFVLLPDMKWDVVTVGALYLVAIAVTPDVRSLRDLTRGHLPMLRAIRADARRIVIARWGLAPTELRMFVHYQPSYYRFHVHIVNANYIGLQGMAAGQAHLLDDIISLLEIDPSPDGSIFQKMTLTYGLGEHHGLFEPMLTAQAALNE